MPIVLLKVLLFFAGSLLVAIVLYINRIWKEREAASVVSAYVDALIEEDHTTEDELYSTYSDDPYIFRQLMMARDLYLAAKPHLNQSKKSSK